MIWLGLLQRRTFADSNRVTLLLYSALNRVMVYLLMNSTPV